MPRAIRITSASGALTVNVTGPAGTAPVVYADSTFSATTSLPATIGDGATSTLWLKSPGAYTLSVKTASGTEIAGDNNQTRTVDLETPDTIAALSYDTRFTHRIEGDSGRGSDTGDTNAAYITSRNRPGYMTPLRESLAVGESCGVAVLGDSTGFDSGAGDHRWFYKLGQALAALYPNYGVQHMAWNDTNQAYDAATIIQAGPLGAPSITFDGTQTATADHPGYGVAITGGFEIRVKVTWATWPPASDCDVFSRWSATNGNRQFRLNQYAAGNVSYQWTSTGTSAGGGDTGTTLFTPSISSRFTGPNVTMWYRVTHLFDNGSAQNVVTFYTSPDGVTWTMIGASPTTTAGTTAMFTPPSYAGGGYDYELGGATGGSSLAHGLTVWEVEARNGIGGLSVVPRYPDLYQPFGATTGITYGGSPMLTLVNGSKVGADITYLTDATRLPKMTPFDYNTVALALNDGHNDTIKRGKDWLASFDSWVTAIRARFPYAPIAVSTQNPKNTPANYIGAHRARARDLRLWAAKNGYGLIDAHRAFIESGQSLAALVQGDGIHSTEAGSVLWAAEAQAAFTSA